MKENSKLHFDTRVLHAGIEPDPSTGAIMTPIFQTSTYVQNAPGDHRGFEYSRTQNPTRQVLENNLASLENGTHGICFSSGMAAIDAVLKILNPGDEIISTNDLYGGSYRLFVQVFEKLGLKFKFTDLTTLDNLNELITEKTRLIWIETPTNPLMRIIDIRFVSDLAKPRGITVAVDNTFASPYLQNPLDLGADLVMHSITKYLGGHSDVVMGALVCQNNELAEKLRFIQNASGAVPGPMDCFLVLRGIKTLHLRMQRHSENGREVAEFLKAHPNVDKVYWPGFKDSVNHGVAKSQMRDYGGMISFSLKGNRIEDALKVLTRCNIFSLAESLGGVESLIGHPASMTHASIPRVEREANGIVDSLIRLSVGIEYVNDLIEDLQNALKF